MPVPCARCSMPLPRWALDAAVKSGAATACPDCGSENTVRAFPAMFADRAAVTPEAALTGEAACFDHPGKRAVAACRQCGRFVCQSLFGGNGRRGVLPLMRRGRRGAGASRQRGFVPHAIRFHRAHLAAGFANPDLAGHPRRRAGVSGDFDREVEAAAEPGTAEPLAFCGGDPDFAGGDSRVDWDCRRNRD